jgi:hypothetical protein
MPKRIFITSSPNTWLDVPRGGVLFDPHFTVPCAPGLVCNPLLDYEHYGTKEGFDVSLARIALSDALYCFWDGWMGHGVLVEIGFALGLEKPVYIGCPRDLAKYAAWPNAATKLFMGTAAECWDMFIKEMAQ